MKYRYYAVFIAFTFFCGFVFIGCGEDRNDNADSLADHGNWSQ